MPQRCITTARAIMSSFLQAWPQASPPFRAGPTHRHRRRSITTTPLATTIRLSLAAKRRYPFKTSGPWPPRAHIIKPNVYPSKIAMRSVLALGLLITLCASADAATVRRFKPHERHLRPTQGVTVPSVTKGFAVPGWTDEQIRYWLYNGSAAAGLG